MSFIAFRHISNGVVAYYPDHYADDPTLGKDLEVYYPEEYEEDKVVLEHDLPVEQRGRTTAVLLDGDKDKITSKLSSNTKDEDEDKN